LKKVAVTGSPGVGKSTVCQFFEDLGARTASADAIVHTLLSSSNTIKEKVIALLGNEVVSNGHIDRQRVADIVFKDTEKLKKLEAILHPAVGNYLQKFFQKATQDAIPLVVVEVPLLFEAGLQKLFDAAIAVTSNVERSPFRDKENRKRLFLPPSVLLSQCQYHITNNGDMAFLKKSVQNLFNQLIQS
jgi:dephospho-CoA kinase